MTGASIFRLVPVADDSDPGWGNATNHGPVLVRALSPADARLVAAGAEVDFLETAAKPSHGVSTRFASAFRDDRLYAVVEVEGHDDLRDGPRCVLSGPLRSNVLKPLERDRTGQPAEDAQGVIALSDGSAPRR